MASAWHYQNTRALALFLDSIAAYRDAICNLQKAIRITCLSVKRKTQNTKYIARGTCDGAPTAHVTTTHVA